MKLAFRYFTPDSSMPVFFGSCGGQASIEAVALGALGIRALHQRFVREALMLSMMTRSGTAANHSKARAVASPASCHTVWSRPNPT
jgi:hypothetical protein